MQTDAIQDRAGVKVEMKTRWNHIKFPGPSWASISSEQPAAKRRGWSRWQAQPPSIGQPTHGQGSHTGPSRGESRNEKEITLYNIPWAPYQIFWAPYFLAGPSIICTPKRLYQCFSENINKLIPKENNAGRCFFYCLIHNVQNSKSSWNVRSGQHNRWMVILL